MAGVNLIFLKLNIPARLVGDMVICSYFYCLALVVLGQQFDFVGCQQHEITNSFYIRPLSNSSYQDDWTKLTEVISSIPAIIHNSSGFQLRFIYDEQYQDVIHSITEFLVGLKGTTMTTYDMALVNLGWILAPVDVEAVVVLLCPADKVLQIFESIKGENLKNTIHFWIVVLSTSEEEHWFRQRIKEWNLRRIRVVFLYRSSFETYRVSVSRVDVNGATCTMDIPLLDKTYINDHQRQYSKCFLQTDTRVLFSDMKGRQLKLATNHARLFAEIKSMSEDGRILDQYGIEISMLKVLSEKTNFTFVGYKSIDGAWGDLLQNGTVTGLIGMVYRGEADIALAGIGITRSRYKVVDYTVPHYSNTLAILSRAPAVKNPTFIVFSSFTSEVWLLIIVITLSVGPILKLLSEVNKTGIHQHSIGSLQLVTFNTFRSVVNQGRLPLISSLSQRTILYSWYIFCIVVSALYSGTLVATFAIPSHEEPIDSLHDFPRAVSEGFTVGTIKGTEFESLFRNAESGIFRDTWLLFKHDLSQSLLPPRQAYGSPVQKKYALISVKSSLEYVRVTQGETKLHLSRESFNNIWMAMVLSKTAPYKETFNQIIFRLIEGGFIYKWKNDQFSKLKKPKVTNTKTSGPQAIRLIHLQAAFYVLLIGSVIGTALLTIEQLYSQYLRQKL